MDRFRRIVLHAMHSITPRKRFLERKYKVFLRSKNVACGDRERQEFLWTFTCTFFSTEWAFDQEISPFTTA